MEKVEVQPSMRSFIIVAVLAAAFSSFTLWLIESWIKYPFFLFEILTITVLYLIVSGHDIELTIKHMKIENVHASLLMDLFLIISALSLLTINALHIQGGLIQLVLALLCTSLLSGYALLNIFGLTRYFSRLETTVLSYILSYAFTGFITLAFLPINKDLRALIVLSSFIVLGLISAFKHRRHQASHVSKSLSKSIDSLALIVAIAFYAISFYFMYPGFALLPGTDISRHYASSVVLWRTPELYSSFGYLLAHLHESALIAISNASTPCIQIALVMLNVMMPLAFYAMAKSYLENIDVRLPSVATIFYSTFSGFAWIYLGKLRLDDVKASELSLLSTVNDQAYNGTMYLAQPFLWYVPLSVSFTILIVQFMLLRKLDIGKKGFVALFSLLTVASYMTHITEAVIFSLFLSFYAFFSKTKKVRLDDALIASIIGFAFLDVFYIMLQYLIGKSLYFSVNLNLLLPTVILIITYVYRRFAIAAKLAKFLSRLAVKSLIKSILYIVTFVYILGLVVWIGGIPSFHTWAIFDVGSIPWFIYPIFLGVIGILTLTSFYYLLEDVKAKKWLMPFIALILFSFVFGRMLTFINVNFFDAGYWEKRFTSYFFLSSAVIAPYVIVKAAESIKAHQNKTKSTFVIATLISIVVIYGLQSSFMVAEYWNIVTSAPTYRSTQKELEAINFLRNTLQQDKYAYTITFTRRSYDTLAFAAPPYKLTGMQVVLTAENPEMSLLSLKAHNLSHAYLYMHSRDYEMLNKHGQSWMARHIIPILPVIYRNNEVTIYNVSSVSFPQTNSTTALIVPFDDSIDPRERWLYAYDILSLGECNYTVTYDLDLGIFLYETLVLSVDPPSKNILEEYFQDDFSNETGWRPISGTWQYTANGLEAGKPGKYQDAIFLSPISAQNFTVSLGFRPLDGDLKVANYVSLIYEWKDERNFKYAGLMFDSSGDVYAYFSRYKNGEVASYPLWVGLKTGLKWQFGDYFNLTVSIKGEIAALYINGSQYLSMKSTASRGELGIRMTRFYKVLFTGFDARISSSVQLRNIEEYLDYVKEGGKLIVLNTNGYGYFADRMLTSDKLAIEADRISASGNIIELPTIITMPKQLPRAENVEIVARYRAQSDSSPYIARERLGSGEIIYFNVHPIAKAVEQSDNKSSLYKTLQELLKFIDIPIEPFIYIPPELSATFRQVEISGNVHVETPSVLFPLDVKFGKVEITHGNTTSMLFNLSRLQISNYRGIHIEATNMSLTDGNGFYSTLTFRAEIVIVSEGNSTSIITSTLNGNVTQFSNVKMITIDDDDPIMLHVRQPTVRVQGSAFFKELYSSSKIYQKTRTQGQDLKIRGSIALNMYLSDVYSWASSLDASGSFERNPPILAYNELSSLPEAAIWGIILMPIFLALTFIIHRRRTK